MKIMQDYPEIMLIWPQMSSMAATEGLEELTNTETKVQSCADGDILNQRIQLRLKIDRY